MADEFDDNTEISWGGPYASFYDLLDALFVQYASGDLDPKEVMS